MDNKNIKNKIRAQIVEGYQNLFSETSIDQARLKRNIESLIEEFVSHEHMAISAQDKAQIVNDLLDEFVGFGPVEKLLKDPSITEIMINGPDNVYMERNGKTLKADFKFDDDTQIMYLAQKMLAPTRRRVDESFPYTEISLKDGSRVNIIIPPVSLNGPTLTIRKFLKEIANAENLIKLGAFDQKMKDFLIAAVRAKVNIIFSGATGAGKTTTLNVLSSYIASDERIVTIEDTAELRLAQDHVVRLETRQPNIEGKGEITIRDLFKNSLRMRPDRIIIGEIRGSEALDMLQAICSGHKGSLGVIHADNPQDVIYRLETMILTSGIPITLEAIHRQIVASINLIVQQDQLLDGSRKITHIAQINGLKDGQAVVEDVFYFDFEGIDVDGSVHGKFKATGVVPVCLTSFKKSGIELSKDIFTKD